MNKERLDKIEIENEIWIIYLGIIFLSYLGNTYEKDYFLTNNKSSKNTYRKLNISVFTILIIVYSYFENEAIKSFQNNNKSITQYKYDTLSLIATTLVLISGFIFLYIVVVDEDILEEVAFN